MSETDQLLQKFMTEGLSSIREVKAQTDSIQRDMTDLKVSFSTLKEQIGNVSSTFSAGYTRLERENSDLSRKIEAGQHSMTSMEKKIIALENKQDSAKIARLEEEVSEFGRRLGKAESQQQKWAGALAVVGIIVGLVVALIVQAGKNIIG